MAKAKLKAGVPVVATQGLTKVFSDFWLRSQVRAVDSLDLTIEPGQVFGLIGPNGSGKSTTIKIILGLLHKTSGRIAVLGKNPSDTAVKERIGYLPEESYLYPYLNPRETLDFYGKLFGYPRKERQRRTDELLQMVGLDAVQYRPIGQFSKGMQRRIGIAQALINDPEFLILDEPTSGLDPIGIRQVKDLVIDLGARGKTILLSSHLLSEVEDVCDRMVILYGGKKRAEGTSDELLTANDRTVIETESLSDEQVAEVTALIQGREGRSVFRVSPARQSLESLFMSIVEQARAERATTHGAGAGGPTAAFLRGQGPDEAPRSGDTVIADLLADEEQAKPASVEDPEEARHKSEPDDSVLDSLMSPESTTPSTRSAPPDGPQRKASDQPREEDVDRSMLDSLLDDDDANRRGEG